MLSRRKFLARALSRGLLFLSGCQRVWRTVFPEVTPPRSEPTSIPSPQLSPTFSPTPMPPLRALVIEHAPQRSEGLDHFLAKNGVEFRLVKIYEGEALPPLEECEAIISSGGPMAPQEFEAPQYGFLREEMDYLLEAIDAGVPILGICLGHQLLAHALGGEGARGEREVGWHKVTLTPEGEADPLFSGLTYEFYVFQYHTDEVVKLPQGAKNLASSSTCVVQAFRYKDTPTWGLQFHPEVGPDLGAKILRSAQRIPIGDMDVEAMILLGYQVYGPSQDMIFENFFALARP